MTGIFEGMEVNTFGGTLTNCEGCQEPVTSVKRVDGKNLCRRCRGEQEPADPPKDVCDACGNDAGQGALCDRGGFYGDDIREIEYADGIRARVCGPCRKEPPQILQGHDAGVYRACGRWNAMPSCSAWRFVQASRDD